MACDSYHRYKEDVRLLKDLGVIHHFFIFFTKYFVDILSIKYFQCFSFYFISDLTVLPFEVKHYMFRGYFESSTLDVNKNQGLKNVCKGINTRRYLNLAQGELC